MNKKLTYTCYDGTTVEGMITKLGKWELEIEITSPFCNWRNSYSMNEVEIRQGKLMSDECEDIGKFLLWQSFEALNKLDQSFESYLATYQWRLRQLDAIQIIPDQEIRKRLTNKIDCGYGNIELYQIGPYHLIFDEFIRSGKIMYHLNPSDDNG